MAVKIGAERSCSSANPLRTSAHHSSRYGRHQSLIALKIGVRRRRRETVDGAVNQARVAFRQIRPVKPELDSFAWSVRFDHDVCAVENVVKRATCVRLVRSQVIERFPLFHMRKPGQDVPSLRPGARP